MRFSQTSNLDNFYFCYIYVCVSLFRILATTESGTVTRSINGDKGQNFSISHAVDKPEFINKIPSMSIVSGKEAVMRCSVKNLGNNVISWHHLESNSDLTVNKQVLTSNLRIKIKQDDDNWLLIINNVSMQDRGFYVCRINWQEPNSQLAYLNVVEAPRFHESSFISGQEITVQEYENLTLSCKASGDPNPEIEWRREDGRAIINSSPNGSPDDPALRSQKRIYGEKLAFRPVIRWSMGSYLCIAANGVPPSVSRRVMITVQFPPVIRIPSHLLITSTGLNVSLRCMVESSPSASQKWIHPNGSHIANNIVKYALNSIETYYFKKLHTLTIFNAVLNDAGEYICHVNNSKGQAKSSIFLQVNPQPLKSKQYSDREDFPGQNYSYTTSEYDFFHPKVPNWNINRMKSVIIRTKNSGAKRSGGLKRLIFYWAMSLAILFLKFGQ